MKFMGLVLTLLTVVAVAQQTPPAGSPPPAQMPVNPVTYISAADIMKRIAATDAATKAGTPASHDPLLYSKPFAANLEYHAEAATSINSHDNDDELFVVLEGSGTLSLGGTLINPTRKGTNMSAASVTGAATRKVAKGDMILVPHNTPHAFTQVDTKLVLMSIHMPVPAGQ